MKKKPFQSAVVIGFLLTLMVDYLFALLLNMMPFILKNLTQPEALIQAGEEFLHHYLLNPGAFLQASLQNDLFIQGQAVILMLFGFLVFKMWWKNRKKQKAKGASDNGAYGTARWSESKEIWDKHHVTSDLNKEGTVLAVYQEKPVIQLEKSSFNRNVAVFGGSGSGKTQSYMIPNLLHTQTKSIVMTDPKGELYESTSQAKRKQGYEVRVLNFVDMNVSDRYNPLDYVEKETDARNVAKTLVSNTQQFRVAESFWINAEVSLLSALILYAKSVLPSPQQHLGSVYNILTQAGRNVEELDQLFERLPKEHPARRAYGVVHLLEDKVRANVFVSATVTLDAWKYEEVRQFTSASDFELQDIGRKPMVIYVIIPVADDTFRPLISNFFSQLFGQLYALADQHQNRLPVGVQMLLDEFTNIGKIPNFAERLSTTRSYGIEMSMIFQSVGQLRDRYGKEQTDEIIGNCDFRLFLGTTSFDSAQYFSLLIGETTQMIQTESASGSMQYEGSSLMQSDELLRLDPSEAILLIRGKYPMQVSKAWCTNFPVFKNAMNNNVSRYRYPAPDRSDYDIFEYSLNRELELSH